MRRLTTLICMLLAPAILPAQVPELQPEIVFKADYGDSEDEYGYVGIVEGGDTCPVNKFYVSADHIYLHDIHQDNIKVYDLEGNYLKTISVKWEKDGQELGLPPITDILVYEGVIYMLCQLPKKPLPEVSTMVVFTYDLETGERFDTIKIYNPSIAGTKRGGYVANAADLRIGPNNSVWIYDHSHDTSFPLVRNGRAVQKSEHMNGVPGILFGSRKIMRSKETGGLSQVDENGSVVRDMDLNRTIRTNRSQKQGEYLVVNDHKKKEDILITWDGHDIGKFRLLHRDTWAIYPINIPWSLGDDGCIYQVFAGYDGIYLYRWSS